MKSPLAPLTLYRNVTGLVFLLSFGASTYATHHPLHVSNRSNWGEVRGRKITKPHGCLVCFLGPNKQDSGLRILDIWVPSSTISPSPQLWDAASPGHFWVAYLSGLKREKTKQNLRASHVTLYRFWKLIGMGRNERELRYWHGSIKSKEQPFFFFFFPFFFSLLWLFLYLYLSEPGQYRSNHFMQFDSWKKTHALSSLRISLPLPFEGETKWIWEVETTPNRKIRKHPHPQRAIVFLVCRERDRERRERERNHSCGIVRKCKNVLGPIK